MSDSVRPQRRQPTRLPRPWDSPGKNTGVGCHFLLQCMKAKSEGEVAQLCPTPSDPMDCSPPGSSAHGIFQARVLEWILAASKFLLLLSFLSLSLSKKPTFPSMNSSHLLHHLNTPRFLTSSISSLCHVLTHSQLRRNCLHPGLGTIVSSQTMF